MFANKIYRSILIVVLCVNYLLANEESFDVESRDPLVVSLGCHCAPAAYMSYFDLRKAAFPFDWIFSNDSRGICELILNDFQGFLESDYLEVHPYLPFVVVNKLYNVEFRHDFPSTGPSHVESILDADWREHLPEIRAKYNRRICRFNQLSAYKGKVYFIRMAYNSPYFYEWPKVITKSEAVDLREALKHKFPNTDFELIIINYTQEITSQEMSNWNLLQIKNYNISEYSKGYEDIFRDLGLLSHNFDLETK